jgi:hypothetical protein
VEFVEVEAVQEAVKLNESELHGRQLKVWILVFFAFTKNINIRWALYTHFAAIPVLSRADGGMLTLLPCFLIRWHQRGLTFLEWSNPAVEVSIPTMATPTWGHMVIVLMAMGELFTCLLSYAGIWLS